MRKFALIALVGLAACSGAPRSETPAPAQEPITVSGPVTSKDQGLQQWIAAFRPRALSKGISAATYDRAMSGLRYDPEVIRRDRNQAEFTKTLWQYLDSAVSDTRITNGRAALRDHGATLQAIENTYGVEKEVVAAVWGMESNYGANRGRMPIIQSLATLSYDGRRGAFFQEQLIAALKIIQAGDTTPANMTGSWAGAMGHTQFIPTSFLQYAVDFTGDGRRDIWSDNPADALASTAAYLKRSGWTKGQPWGVEVVLPSGFNYGLASRSVSKSPSQWQAMGVRAAAGGSIPNYGSASILVPGGAQGVAFMIFGNFRAIERYNAADAYVIGVGHLSDRLRGKGPFVQAWPRGEQALSSAQKSELQRRLTAKGFDTGGVDGKIGPDTINAIRRYQVAAGLTADGFPSLSLLNHLR